MIDWVKVRSFESEVIEGSKISLVSLYYSTRDSDLLVSLSIFPNAIHSFGGKSSLSTKSVSKLVVEGKLFLWGGSGFSICWGVVGCFSAGIGFGATVVDGLSPRVVIT